MRISEGLVKISVRELVEFVLREGSITSTMSSSNRAILGTLAHKKIQESMEANYEAEVKMVHECEKDDITFLVEGRADGVIRDLVGVTIDEIKTTTRDLSLIDENYNPLHWAQAKCYAYFYAKENAQREMQVRLTYYHIETKEIKYLQRGFFFDELEAFFTSVITKYAKWIRFYMDWTEKRDGSLKELAFPFESYRQGQRELAVNVYKSIQQASTLYVSAPTGIGKTISTLFPALKAMGEGHGTKIFYLTAKTITRTIAEEATQRLYENGAKIKAITLTAKDKICFCEKRQCHPDYCEWANGHYDRVDEAVYEIINEEDLISRNLVEDYARKYRVCPFELALDLAIWADIVICDYNYVFDPSVGLKRFTDNKDFILLVDEAHNLVDRAREMYSANLSKRQILSVKKNLGKGQVPISRELTKLNEWFLDLRRDYIDELGVYISQEAPKNLYQINRRLIAACDKKLQQGGESNLPADLVDLYFEVYSFNRIYELFDEHYIVYGESSGQEVTLKLFCIDPSVAINSITSTCKSAIFFSATLLPIDYYRYMLGGKEDRAIAFDSPFIKEHALRLIITDVSTRFRHREGSYKKICQVVYDLAGQKVGHYMVFFPSYKYMSEVFEALKVEKEVEEVGEEQPHNCFKVYDGWGQVKYEIHKQRSEMTEEEREQFLERFTPNPEVTTINLCVLGGIFSEGIDLTGTRLIGVIVVGVGLPQLGLERDLIKSHFEEEDKEGYHYAYTYPGMNKVLQAVGRLIRTEEDKGVIALIDDRFNTPLYEGLLTPEFNDARKVRSIEVGQQVKKFWQQNG